MIARLARILTVTPHLAALVFACIYLAALARHAQHLLVYPFPLDYGEGPLLAQIERLQRGIPIWALYSDPAAPPYQIVNYPPSFLLITVGLSSLFGAPLLVGRSVSLLSACGCVLAIGLLTARALLQQQTQTPRWRIRAAFLTPLALFSIPIFWEWATVLRVDTFGICLGLWGIVLLQKAQTTTQPDDHTARRSGEWPSRFSLLFSHVTTSSRLQAICAGLLLLGCLADKPSLLAAPITVYAVGLITAFRRERVTLFSVPVVIAFLVTFGGGVVLLALMQIASGGWFWLHVITANANHWDKGLALVFWMDQARLRWALGLAAMLAVGGLWLLRQHMMLALPLTYTTIGLLAALGVGKVGAYSNYFLEAYIGLVWLVSLGTACLPLSTRKMSMLYAGIGGALTLSMLFYPPVWSETSLRRAGLLEASPMRVVVGQYALWQDLTREEAVLAALERVQSAIHEQLVSGQEQLLTDVPGIAAGSNVMSRYQAFEQRQLIDQGLSDQRPLLHALANGEIPLAVLDYLGNWLTPQMVAIIRQRYAQDGSLGTYDLYRPVVPGRFQPRKDDLPQGLSLTSVAIRDASSPADASIQVAQGSWLLVTTIWQRHGATTLQAAPEVVLDLLNDTQTLARSGKLLLYDALAPDQWEIGQDWQHMQVLEIPSTLLTGTYRLQLRLRGQGFPEELVNLGTITVTSSRGRFFPETQTFVPARFLAYWQRIGGIDRAGYPLMPTVPFSWGLLQCFERLCLEQRGAEVHQRPLGSMLYLAEAQQTSDCSGQPQPIPQICPAFRPFWQNHHAQEELGNPISGALIQAGLQIQWTQFARMERGPDSTSTSLGRLGAETLRLPPGVRYRWQRSTD